jgi:hypothetical protein
VKIEALVENTVVKKQMTVVDIIVRSVQKIDYIVENFELVVEETAEKTVKIAENTVVTVEVVKTVEATEFVAEKKMLKFVGYTEKHSGQIVENFVISVVSKCSVTECFVEKTDLVVFAEKTFEHLNQTAVHFLAVLKMADYFAMVVEYIEMFVGYTAGKMGQIDLTADFLVEETVNCYKIHLVYFLGDCIVKHP